MKLILTYLTLIFYFSPLYSNTFSIVGRVVDSSTGSPVPFATVFMANTTIGTITGKIGYDDHSRPISIDHPNALVLWVLH